MKGGKLLAKAKSAIAKLHAYASKNQLYSKAHGIVKEKKLISKGLKHLGYNGASKAAEAVGYGRRKRRMRGRGKDDYPDVAPARPQHPRHNYVDAAEPKAWHRSLGGIHRKIRDERIISRGLAKVGLKRASRAAHLVGYGRVRRMRGGSFFGKIGNWFKGAANTVYNKVLKPTHDYIKRKHIISNFAGFIPHPAGKAIALGAKLAGYGRRKRVMRGGRRAVQRGGMHGVTLW